ncbi:MAG: hypothetical protein WCK17_17060 [Verrucomicrobiota bacterium]
MEIKFECPTCGQHISATSDQFGTTGQCPNCRASITVPDLARSKGRLAKYVTAIIALIVVSFAIAAFTKNWKDNSHPERLGVDLARIKDTARPRTPAEAPAIAVKTTSNVDERLFLLRLLEELYFEWPSDASNPQQLQKVLGELRHRANRHYEDLTNRKLDDKLASLFADFLSAVDSYTSFLVSIGKIQADAVARAEKESAESGFNAGFAGGSIAAENDDLLAGVGVAVISYLWDDYNKSKARDAARERAVNAAYQELRNKVSTYTARAQNAALAFAQKYSWQRAEAGFDEPPDQAERMTSLVKANDLAGILQIMDAARRRRPRDPFALSRRAYTYSLDARLTPKDMVSASNQCLDAASLVPSGRIYDEYRGWFLYSAGDIANRAATKEIGNSAWSTACNPTAAYATRLWDECLKFTPNDPTGEFGERRAWALMQSGHLEKALEQARSVEALRGKTIRFALNYSMLLSASGDTEMSYKWFEYTVRGLGYNNIALAKTDPDLAAMRKAKRTAFDDLTAFRVAYWIDWGVLNDDVSVRNDSAFPITNVVYRAHITSNGRTWTPELKVDRIDPGKTHTWPNVFSIPGSRNDQSSTVTITTDQNR